MPKNNNRETVSLGHPTLADIKARLDKQVDKTVRTQSEIAKALAASEAATAAIVGRGALADLIDRETAAMNAAADAKERALFDEGGGYGMQVCPACNGVAQTGSVCSTCKGAQLVERRVDPGDVVGLDEVTPDSETAVDGDSKRTDPNAG